LARARACCLVSMLLRLWQCCDALAIRACTESQQCTGTGRGLLASGVPAGVLALSLLGAGSAWRGARTSCWRFGLEFVRVVVGSTELLAATRGRRPRGSCCWVVPIFMVVASCLLVIITITITTNKETKKQRKKERKRGIKSFLPCWRRRKVIAAPYLRRF
jgi:hypothetical protein